MQPLRMIPLFNTQNGMPVGYYLYTQSRAVSPASTRMQRTNSHTGAPKLTELQSAAKMDRAFLLQTGRAAADAREAWRKLDNALSLRFGADAPSMRKVTALLDQICDVIVELGGVDTAAAEVPAIEAASSESDAATANAPAGGTPSPAPGAIRTREDALRELNRIADFFRRTEPHSPLAYTLDEAVRRGRIEPCGAAGRGAAQRGDAERHALAPRDAAGRRRLGPACLKSGGRRERPSRSCSRGCKSPRESGARLTSRRAASRRAACRRARPK